MWRLVENDYHHISHPEGVGRKAMNLITIIDPHLLNGPPFQGGRGFLIMFSIKRPTPSAYDLIYRTSEMSKIVVTDALSVKILTRNRICLFIKNILFTLYPCYKNTPKVTHNICRRQNKMQKSKNKPNKILAKKIQK